jgi:ligand-binding sensor domain-containing protein
VTPRVLRPPGAGAVAAAAVAAFAVVLVAAAARDRRVRHLAVPVLADPSLPRAPGADLAERAGCEVREVARVPGRVTALLEEAGAGGEGRGEGGSGVLWIGTFDEGLFRLAGGGLSAVEGLRGRERFVNALASHDGLVWAATQGGVAGFDGGRRAVTLLAGEGATALARAGSALYAGAARGLFRLSAGAGGEPVEAAGPGGEPLRVTALAASATRLWIGTASGAYSLPLATLEAPLLARTARWHPLVFGSPPAETNVVTALASLADGALAGTDDGGVVRLGDGGAVSALRFADPRANEVNPGAAVAAPGGAVLAGTQGGGVLLVRPAGAALAAERLQALARAEVSALRTDGARVLAGTAQGAVLEVRCAEGAASAARPGDRVVEPVLAEEQLAPDEEVGRAEDPEPRGLGGPVAERLLDLR